MSRIKRHIWNLFLLGLMIFCFGISIIYSSKFQDQQEIYMLYYRNDPIDSETAMGMQKEETQQDNPMDFTVWGMTGNIKIKNPELNREADIRALMLCGASDLLVKSDGYLDQEDYEGCLISGDMAYDLFGSRTASEQILEYNGRELVVRGIIKDAEKTIAMQNVSNSDIRMDSIALKIPENQIPARAVNQFSERNGYADDEVNLYDFISWAKVLTMLMPILMGIILLAPYFKNVFQLRYRPVVFAAGMIIGMLGLAALCWFGEVKFGFPQDYIPNQWSDFISWEEIFQKKSDNFKLLLFMEKREPERIIIDSFLQTAKYSIFSLGIFIFFVRRFCITHLRTLYIYGISCFFFAFLTVLLNGANGEILAGSRKLWFLPIVYLSIKLIYEKNERSLIKTDVC